jgi:hypothetical protein
MIIILPAASATPDLSASRALNFITIDTTIDAIITKQGQRVINLKKTKPFPLFSRK